MKKVLILGFAKIAYMPYLNFYLEALNGHAEIHVVTWQRDHTPDQILSPDIVLHPFRKEQTDESGKLSKLGNFARYRIFVRSLLKQQKFDRIIVLHTLPGVLLADTLCKEYHNLFIFDYRDYTYEGFSPFRRIVCKLVRSSFSTFVSSDAFRPVLPKLEKVYTSHNLLTDSLNHREVRSTLPRPHAPIRIAFWGFIRHETLNRRLIELLGGDARFELHYYGREQQTAENLKALVEERHYSNVFFHGAYLPEDRYAFAAQTDLIHNMYENSATMQKAIANKYYDGVIFRIPQLCTKDSYMGERVTEEQTGLALDLSVPDTAEQIVRYYSNLDWSNFEQNCDCAVNRVVDEYNGGIERITALLS